MSVQPAVLVKMALLALIHSVAINATVLKDFKEKIVIKVIIIKYFPFLFSEVNFFFWRIDQIIFSSVFVTNFCWQFVKLKW